MKINGEFKKDDEVYCQFQFDVNNRVESFSATITTYSDDIIVLNLKARIPHDKEMLNTIKNKVKGGN
jgi:hypothetical protein